MEWVSAVGEEEKVHGERQRKLDCCRSGAVD